MNRLFQKCLIASGGMHLLLALILIVCPAFLTSKPKRSEVEELTFINPDILIDGNFSNPGGSPGRLPPPQAPPAPPAPPSPPVPAPAPHVEPVKPPTPEVAPQKTTGESLEVAKPGKKKLEVSLTPVVRPSSKPRTNETSAEDTQAREQQAWRQGIAKQFVRSAGNIRSGTGSATAVKADGFGSGNGPSYASYRSYVWGFFRDAWVAPDDATSDDSTAEVTVTIARDGTVVAKRITKKSGDPAVDASVQRVLDRVSTVGRPFPEGATDQERTYIIPFNAKARRGTA
jgi:TonB family protein